MPDPTKATPRPWAVEYDPTAHGEPATLIMQAHAEMWEKWIAVCQFGKDGDAEDGDGDGKRDCTAAEAQANADLIVRAVNSFDAAQEALSLAANVLFLLEEEVKALGHRAENVTEKVNAALAKCNGVAR